MGVAQAATRRRRARTALVLVACIRNALQDEEVGQNADHIDRLELAGDTDRQAFMGELVEHVEHPILASLVGAVLDKVVGPDMIALLWPQLRRRSC